MFKLIYRVLLIMIIGVLGLNLDSCELSNQVGSTPVNGLSTLQGQAYMATSGVISSISTDNTVTQTVTFYNAGMGTATAINLSLNDSANGYPTTPLASSQTWGSRGGVTLAVISNTCTKQAGGSGNASVTAGGKCAVSFKMLGSVQFGTVYLEMSYNTGTGTETTGYSTYYYPPNNPTELVSSITSSSKFVNTQINQTRTETVTVSNSNPKAITTLSDNASLLTMGNPGVPTGMNITANTCMNGLRLTNNTCSYTLTYAPTAVTLGQVTNLFGLVRGAYVNQGNTYPLSASTQFIYSSQARDLDFNPDMLDLKAKVGKSDVFSLIIINKNALGSGAIKNISFNWSKIGLNDVEISNDSPHNCLSNLDYSDRCTVLFRYSPDKIESSAGKYLDLPVTYTGGKSTIEYLPTKYQSTP